MTDPDLANARICLLEQQVEQLRWRLRHEALRVDSMLGDMEGLASFRERFLAARETAAYRRAFEAADPLVTVCVGTMDRAELLTGRCLPSILAQTHANLQVVVVGDHAPASLEERIAALGDERIEFVNLPRRGPYPRPGPDRWHVAGTAPVAEALARVRGAFVTHLDDDDAYEPDRIATLLAAARTERADFLWHPFLWQQPDGGWKQWGNGTLENGEVGGGMIFYHAFFAALPMDVFAYRRHEPGDWNRIRRIVYCRPHTAFVPRPLTRYHRDGSVHVFELQEGETFLD